MRVKKIKLMPVFFIVAFYGAVLVTLLRYA